MVARKLHEEQPWYHGNISREAADRIMSQSEHHDGKFLYVCLIISSIHRVLIKRGVELFAITLLTVN